MSARAQECSMEEERTRDLDRLVERAKRVPMTPHEKEEQRRSFAFGNAKIENERVTRQIIDLAAETMSKEKKAED